MDTLFKSKKYVTNSIYVKKALELNLSLPEFLMLMYFDNDYNNYLDIEKLSKNLGLNIDTAYQVFNSLISKKLISIDTAKDLDNRMIEHVNLDNFYQMLIEDQQKENKKNTKNDIYSIFEKEFGRLITSIEYEIINGWLEKGYNEELIIGALKEAVYNGTNNLRYIDKILYEWSKKGFKTMKDVNNQGERQPKKEDRKELFDYNWLEDEE